MRPLSAREKFLLCVLLVVALVSAYLALFYGPVTTKMTEVDEQLGQTEDQLLESQIKVTRLEKMNKELEELNEGGGPLIGLARYDNLQSVIVELNGILSQTSQYSLDFGTVDTSQPIVRRNITLNFSAGSYEQAKTVLRELHDCKYRCLLSAFTINDQNRSGKVQVSVTMTFFEYQDKQ